MGHRPVSERLGVFGGTFDPPHVGHLIAAADVRHELGLDRILMVVANEPWQKLGSRDLTPASDRLAMVRAAVAGVDGLEASAIEIERGGTSYTADTLADLAAARPGVQLYLILGADAAAGFTTWERYEDVVAQARLVVVDRPGAPVTLAEGVPWQRIAAPRLEISSTDLRRRVGADAPIDFLVPAGVVTYITEHGLYRVGR
ncbi:MAG: nadD [Acidimicrobiales bacterium]|nr:nadD [Acidimicrobiales bacterium]